LEEEEEEETVVRAGEHLAQLDLVCSGPAGAGLKKLVEFLSSSFLVLVF